MATKEEPTSEASSGNYVDCHTISAFLKARQYERVTEILDEALLTSEQTNEAILADILVAARQICLALVACQAETEWHQRACEEASRRKQQLEQQLQAMFNLVNNLAGSPTQEKPVAAPPLPKTEVNPPHDDNPKSVKSHSLWQRLQNLLAWSPAPWSPEPPASAPSAEAWLVSSAEKVEMPAQTLPATVKVEGSAILPGQEAEAPAAPPAGKAEAATLPPVTAPKQAEQGIPSLVVHCLGPFRVYQDDRPVEDWPSGKGKSILKYLVTHRERPVAKEVLMDLFWPDANPDAARNNLNVAIYGLRLALHKLCPDFSHILFQADHYLLNPEIQIWVDLEEFMERFRTAQNLERRGELALALREYRAAEALYQGEFLEEDRYEDWLLPQRQSLQDYYLNLLDRLSHYYLDQEEYDACATMCHKMLTVDACREEAHRRLMRYYSQQQQRYLALRQYHFCVEALARVLDVSPSQTTIELYEQIRQSQ